MTAVPAPSPDVAFGAAVTVAALFVSLPRALTWRAWVPRVQHRNAPWRASVLACAGLAALALWHPVAVALMLTSGIVLIALATDLASTDEALHAEEATFEAPLHAHAD